MKDRRAPLGDEKILRMWTISFKDFLLYLKDYGVLRETGLVPEVI